jgi:hypothetical protein
MNTVSSLCDEIASLCVEIGRQEFRLLELIRELNELKPWARCEFLSCAHWLNVRCGLDLATAREKVRVAHALGRLPQIWEAFRAGRVSYSKVRAITRIADARNEEDLVEKALALPTADLERYVKTQRQIERLEERRAAFKAYRHRTFSCRWDTDGSLAFEGRLSAEQGAILLQAMDRCVEWLYREQPYRRRRLFDEARIQDIPLEQRRADGLAALAERFLAQPPQADEGLATADRFQVTINVSAETLPEYGEIDPEDPPTIEDGPVVAAETARRVCCDAAVIRVVESGVGEPLDVGRKTRVIPPAIRRALKRRDRRCRFPGCVNRRFVDGHHIVHWADGGATRLDNLILLCRHHHRVVHEGGYFIVKDGSGFAFCRWDGSKVSDANDGVVPMQVPAFVVEEERLFRHADDCRGKSHAIGNALGT